MTSRSKQGIPIHQRQTLILAPFSQTVSYIIFLIFLAFMTMFMAWLRQKNVRAVSCQNHFNQ